jgi:hypothetical protein
MVHLVLPVHLVHPWNGASITFDETTTTDIGDTSLITLSMGLAGPNVRFRATNTSGFDFYIVFNIKQLGIILT